MDLLVTSDGPDTLKRAAEYVQLLPQPSSTTLLLTINKTNRADRQRDVLEELVEHVRQTSQSPVEIKMISGDPVEVVPSEAQAGDYDLVVLGVHQQRRLTHIRPKRIAKELANRLHTPLLVVSPAWDKLDRILIWTSGEEIDEMTIRGAGQLAASIDAEATVLHVMSQIPLTADADTKDLDRNAESLMKHQTHEGKHFERAVQILAEAGVPSDRRDMKVRHGLTLEEVIKESEEGDFDLIVAGAPQVSEQEDWSELRELLQEDMAVEILQKASRPTLIMRSHEGEEDFAR